MDGRTIFRKALGSWLSHRLKDQSCEMWATDDGGIEVTRGGRTLWRLSDSEMGAPEGGRRRWGVTADDIMD